MQWFLGTQGIVTKWCQRYKLSHIRQEHISPMQMAWKRLFPRSSGNWKKQTKQAYLIVRRNIRRSIWAQLRRNLKIKRHRSWKWNSSLKNIQVFSYTCWVIMVSKIRSEGIWPSVKLLKTTEKNTASISMAICWSGLISKDRQGNLQKVCRIIHWSLIHVVTNMEWTNRDGIKCIYTGEVDQNGLVCGEGVAFG